MVAAPMIATAGAGQPGRAGPGPVGPAPVIDPAGTATAHWLARKAVPTMSEMSVGLVIHDAPLTRVPWPGLRIPARLFALRLLNLLLALIPLAVAVPIFDRFDPARRRPRGPERAATVGAAAQAGPRSTAVQAVTGAGSAGQGQASAMRSAPAPAASADLAPGTHVPSLGSVAARPSFARAVVAEALLIWRNGSFLKWPLLAASLFAGIVPGPIGPAPFLLLLVPLISEVAAREDLAGTRALVLSQPAVPTSAVVWKSASVALVLFVLGAPLMLRCAWISPARGLACAAGLLCIALAAVGLGALTSGGKLFSALYLVAWYMAVSGLSVADPTSSLGRDPNPALSGPWLALGLALAAAAMLRERVRRI
jgi:hypothetical protein